jgi:hypothetical protein
MNRSINEKINMNGFYEQHDCRYLTIPNICRKALSKNYIGIFKNWEKQKGLNWNCKN